MLHSQKEKSHNALNASCLLDACISSSTPSSSSIGGRSLHSSPAPVLSDRSSSSSSSLLLSGGICQCDVCGKVFSSIYRFQRHCISHVESKEMRKFGCDICQKAFKFKHHLKEHMRIHSGEKPFHCAHCGKSFSHSGSYSSHMSSKKCAALNAGSALPSRRHCRAFMNPNPTTSPVDNNSVDFLTAMDNCNSLPPGWPLSLPYLAQMWDQFAKWSSHTGPIISSAASVWESSPFVECDLNAFREGSEATYHLYSVISDNCNLTIIPRPHDDPVQIEPLDLRVVQHHK